MEVIRSEQFQLLAKMASNSWDLSGCFWAFYPFKTRVRWAWNGLAFGTGIWYCADTAISALGAEINMNDTDVHERRCPECHKGAAGIKYWRIPNS